MFAYMFKVNMVSIKDRLKNETLQKNITDHMKLTTLVLDLYRHSEAAQREPSALQNQC